jgi:DNA polymerase elongation subunit (family B)
LKKRQPHWLECPGYAGRLVLDIFHHIRENHPGLPGEGAYKLNGVSQHFLGERKEDINYKQIPILQSGGASDRRDLAIYCLKVCDVQIVPATSSLMKDLSRTFIFHFSYLTS